MSRKAKVPVILPQGVEAKLEGGVMTVKGPKGVLSQNFTHGVTAEVAGSEVKVSLLPEYTQNSNFLGLYWSLLSNMVQGVSAGFTKELEMIGVGFRAAIKGKLIDLQLGFSHPVELPIPEGLEVKVDKNVNFWFSF